MGGGGGVEWVVLSEWCERSTKVLHVGALIVNWSVCNSDGNGTPCKHRLVCQSNVALVCTHQTLF